MQIYNPFRIRSLRAHLIGGMGMFYFGLVIVGLGIHFYIRGTMEEQAEAQIRALSRHQAQQALFLALLEQEVSIRDTLATGNPNPLEGLQQGLQAEKEAIQNTLDNLGPGDKTAAKDEFAQLQQALDERHQMVANFRTIKQKQKSLKNVRAALDEEKKQFESIRWASELLERKLDDRDNTRLLNSEQALNRAHFISVVALMISIVVAILRSRWILRKVSVPMTILANQAHEGKGFQEPEEGNAIHEVDILSRALFQLDQRVAEREQDLRQKHEEAVAAQAFTQLVQRIHTEDELLRALAQALDRLVQPKALRILLRSSLEKGDRLLPSVAMSPLSTAHGGLAKPVPDVSTEPGLAPFPGESVTEDPKAHPIFQDSSLCRAIRDGSPVDLASRASTACLCELGVPKSGSYLCLPFVASGQVLGLVNLQAENPKHWTSSRRQLAESCVSAAAAALQALRALNLANERAIRDALTGVFNRRFMDELLPKLVDQTKRQNSHLSALMLDIDHFKSFNDRFGHEVGDRVLASFAHALLEGVRSGDVVTRYGGEEFTVILPHTNYNTALHLAERLRQSVESIKLLEPEFPSGCHITCSIGAATLPDHAKNGEDLLSVADKALYCAKGLGRNRVTGAGESDPMTTN